MSLDEPLKRSGRRTGKSLWLITPLSSCVVLGAWIFWAFVPVLSVRRIAVGVCCVVIVGSLAVLIVSRRGAKQVGLADAYASVRPTDDGPSVALPAAVPSGGLLRVRGLLGMVGFFAALIGSWGLAGGDDVHASQAAGIRDAGPRVVAAPVLKVSDLERYAGRSDTDFSATITVLLKGAASQPNEARVTLEANTHEEPQRGGHLKVMYAPNDLSLGAVHGDAVTLDRLMSGKAMSAGLALGLTIAIVGMAVVLIGMTVSTGGFRFVTRVDRDVRALRGSCAGFGRWSSSRPDGDSDNECLLIRGERGETVHFWVERQAAATARAAGEESVWACWKAVVREKRVARTPAVLIGDSGWALHGEMWIEEAQELEGIAPQSVGSGGAPVDELRTVRVWSPVTSWPLIMPLSSVVFVLVALAAVGVCLTDFAARWRGGLGVITSVAMLGALVMYVRSATKRAEGFVRDASQAPKLDAKAGR